MGSIKVTVYGRVKPCPKNLRSKEYRVKTGDDEDSITFTTVKPLPAEKTFRFRKIFTEQATQEDVFETVAKPVIENVLSGYNGTIFTYGQTGSGKTYTMTGDIEGWIYPGLIPRAIERIFQLKDKSVSVYITYCEIYNEHVYDLIRSDRTNSDLAHVNVLEDSTGMTRFRNLSAHMVNTAYEAMQLLIRGDSNKVVAETSSNPKSSRSHVLFSITLEVPHPSREKLYLKPVLYLVDLAGSEKLSKSKSQTGNPWETRYINLSLHYLEQVLLALRQPGRAHIPYRNSLMTALLRNSLGGNCITSMIATFSLSIDDLEETIQTCRFSERIASIRNEVKITEFFNPDREIEELRRENERLKSQIKIMGGQLSNHELSQEEKEKCFELVQSFIESSATETLPFADVKRMEYCLFLMRDEIIKKPKAKTIAETSKPNTVLDFLKNCNRATTFDLEPQTSSTFNLVKSEKNWSKKSPMNLPKVNIRYTKWRSIEKLTEKDNTTIKKINAEILEKKLTSIGPSFTSNNAENIENNKVIEPKNIQRSSTPSFPVKTFTTQNEIQNDSQNDNNNNHNTITSLLEEEKNALQHSEEDEDMREDFETWPTSFCLPDATASDTTFKIEVMDNKESTGECLSFGKLKKLISVGVQIDNEIGVESEGDEDYGGLEMAENLSVKSSESSRFSWNRLPLTGDLEVDEEILKFYKARYKMFKKEENQQSHES